MRGYGVGTRGRIGRVVHGESLAKAGEVLWRHRVQDKQDGLHDGRLRGTAVVTAYGGRETRRTF
ncbi:hypothetical protein GCM10027081_38920 [Cupriavidus yeoncheonensis]